MILLVLVYGWDTGAVTIQEDGVAESHRIGLVKGTVPSGFPLRALLSIDVDLGDAGI